MTITVGNNISLQFIGERGRPNSTPAPDAKLGALVSLFSDPILGHQHLVQTPPQGLQDADAGRASEAPSKAALAWLCSLEWRFDRRCLDAVSLAWNQNVGQRLPGCHELPPEPRTARCSASKQTLRLDRKWRSPREPGKGLATAIQRSPPLLRRLQFGQPLQRLFLRNSAKGDQSGELGFSRPSLLLLPMAKRQHRHVEQFGILFDGEAQS